MSPSLDNVRTADSKDLCVVWDFPDLLTRFVTRLHSGLSLPGGYAQFAGAEPLEESGTALSVADNRLTVGTASFSISDEASALTTWVKANDGKLSSTRVIRREGYVGVAEAEYIVTRWLVRDFGVSDRAGGGYTFELDNMLGPMTRPLYEAFDGEAYRLGSVTRNGALTNNSAVVTGLSQTSDLLAGMAASGTNVQENSRILSVDSASQITMTKTATGGGTQSLTFTDLVSAATTIKLETSPKGIWREPGFALLYNRDDKVSELVSYQSIGGTANLDLQTVVRKKFGVGPTSYRFDQGDSEIAQVWVKRGNPIDVALEWLSTTATGESPSEKLTNGDFETWSSATDAGSWTETITGGTINREATLRVQGAYSCRADRTGAGALTEHQDLSLAAGKWYRLRIACRGSAAITNGLRVLLRNVTTNKELQSDGQTWGTPTQVCLAADVDATARHFWLAFKTDPTFGGGDTYRLILDASNIASGQSVYWELASVFGPFSSAPNGPYDVGDGDGLGAWIKSEMLSLAKIEAVRDQYWPIPAFSGDTKSSGTAVLFVEKEPIDDLKRFIGEHILTPFALFPAVDLEERFSIEAWFHTAPAAAAVGDKWDKREFSAAQWKRNIAQRINYASLLTDWDAFDGRHAYRKGRDHDPSILRFGKSKAFEMSGRGCRSGRRSFPDYGSIADLDSAATRIFQEAGNPWSDMTVRAFWEFGNISIAQAITINIPNIPDLVGGRRGITDGLFLVTRRRRDWKTGSVLLTIRLRRALSRPGRVAPNTVASTYAAATAADREYCYVAPGSTFANGDDAYTVV